MGLCVATVTLWESLEQGATLASLTHSQQDTAPWSSLAAPCSLPQPLDANLGLLADMTHEVFVSLVRV